MRGDLLTLVPAYAEGMLKGPEVTPPNRAGRRARCRLESSVLGGALCCFIAACAFVVMSTNGK